MAHLQQIKLANVLFNNWY